MSAFCAWEDCATDRGHLSVINPANGQVITKISEATEKDVDIAVEAAHAALAKTWGLNASGTVRSHLLGRLADLMEKHSEELAALEALDNGAFYR